MQRHRPARRSRDAVRFLLRARPCRWRSRPTSRATHRRAPAGPRPGEDRGTGLGGTVPSRRGDPAPCRTRRRHRSRSSPAGARFNDPLAGEVVAEQAGGGGPTSVVLTIGIFFEGSRKLSSTPRPSPAIQRRPNSRRSNLAAERSSRALPLEMLLQAVEVEMRLCRSVLGPDRGRGRPFGGRAWRTAAPGAPDFVRARRIAAGRRRTEHRPPSRPSWPRQGLAHPRSSDRYLGAQLRPPFGLLRSPQHDATTPPLDRRADDMPPAHHLLQAPRTVASPWVDLRETRCAGMRRMHGVYPRYARSRFSEGRPRPAGLLDALLDERRDPRRNAAWREPARCQPGARPLARPFSDRLLVDGPGGYLLTARAEGCGRLATDLGRRRRSSRRPGIDPAQATGPVRLLMLDLEAAVVAPRLIASLAEQRRASISRWYRRGLASPRRSSRHRGRPHRRRQGRPCRIRNASSTRTTS